MIKPINIRDNVGNSVHTINNNLAEFEAKICNLNTDNIRWQDALRFWNLNDDKIQNMTNAVNNLSAKWNNMANIVHSLSSFWNGHLTFIYPTPFVEGTQNIKPLHDFLIDNHNPANYNTDQIANIYFFIQNYEAIENSKKDIFQKSVSARYFQNTGTDWIAVSHPKNDFCKTADCNDIYQVIDVNKQYSCSTKTEILYYLISP